MFSNIFLYIKTNTTVGSHEFSRNQKIVKDSFPLSLGTEPKNCHPWDLTTVTSVTLLTVVTRVTLLIRVTRVTRVIRVT